jgi:hypothetical protein
VQHVSYGPLIMSIMSCYTGFFNVRRGWQSLNTGHRFYLRLIRRTGWLWIYTSRTTDGRPFKPKKLSVPFLYPGVPAGLTPFRGLVPLGRRNLVPILPPAHPLGGGWLYINKYTGIHIYIYKHESALLVIEHKYIQLLIW